MRRGDVVTVAAGGGFGGKPRPAVVIQSDALAAHSTVVLLLFTTSGVDTPILRPAVDPHPDNGLREQSRVMADVPVSVRRDRVGPVVGRLSPDDLARAERALLLALGFA